MATIIPALRGKLGNTEFFETTWKVVDLVKSVKPPTELEGWAGFSIQERIQRDPDLKRIKQDLAPYIANSEDRFFGSIIVLVYEGEVTWESISAFAKGIPAAYKSGTEQLGFITIDGATLVVLDGQHRLRALMDVYKGDVVGPAAANIANDDVCVILIRHEGNMKTRRIFNVVNRYAKQTGRGDNIITSEDDGYAIVARTLVDDDDLFGRRQVKTEMKDFVEWKSNTLAKRSLAFTTISAVYESIKLVLQHNGVEALKEQQRPTDEEIEKYSLLAKSFWETLMSRIEAYKRASDNMGEIPELRAEGNPTALLFKPAHQIALVDGLMRAAHLTNLSVETLADRVNQVADWSMTNPMWTGIIMKTGGTIDAGQDARRRTSALIAYLIAADQLSDEYKLSVWKLYNESRAKGIVDAWEKNGFIPTEDGKPEDLPTPVTGEAFTVENARALMNLAEAA